MNLRIQIGVLSLVIFAFAQNGQQFQDLDAQPIGIDLSITTVYASSYNITTQDFTSLAALTAPENFANFLAEIYHRHVAEQRNNYEAWKTFRETTSYRNFILGLKRILGASRLPAGLATSLPTVLKDDEFRYQFRNNLDLPSTDGTSWIEFALGYVPTFLRSLKFTTQEARH